MNHSPPLFYLFSYMYGKTFERSGWVHNSANRRMAEEFFTG